MIAARLRASHVALGGAVLTIVSVGAIQAYRILKSRKPALPPSGPISWWQFLRASRNVQKSHTL